jgi:lysophospholipase L1-like esterase
MRAALSSILSFVVFAFPCASACVVRLTDKNAPAENGAVTGAPADCSQAQVPPGGAPGGSAEIKFVGRYVFDRPPGNPNGQDQALFDWSGNYLSFRVTGTSTVTVKLDLSGDVPQDQLFEFLVDNDPPGVRQVTVQQNAAGQPTNVPLEGYDIDGLEPGGQHEITIHKNTEAQQGAVEFKGLDLHGGHLLPPTRRARRIEFIGDSIMCGYGDEGQNATCPFDITIREARDANGNIVPGPDGKPIDISLPVTENQWLSFTSRTARALDADAVTVCWSGKGVYLNYKEKAGDPDAKSTIPDLWQGRTMASDPNGQPWDFSKEKPDEAPQVVVISLGTNDYSRDTLPPNPDPNGLPGDNVPDGDMNDPAVYEQFVAKYTDLVKQVRQRRPNAHIFLAVPPMVSDEFPLTNARTGLKNALLRIVGTQAAAGDTKVYEMELVEMGFRYGLGCDYHPNLAVHQIMSEQLIGAIKSKTCW